MRRYKRRLFNFRTSHRNASAVAVRASKEEKGRTANRCVWKCAFLSIFSRSTSVCLSVSVSCHTFCLALSLSTSHLCISLSFSLSHSRARTLALTSTLLLKSTSTIITMPKDPKELAFLKAAEVGDLEAVQKALDEGTPIHTTDDGSNTCLHLVPTHPLPFALPNFLPLTSLIRL